MDNKLTIGRHVRLETIGGLYKVVFRFDSSPECAVVADIDSIVGGKTYLVRRMPNDLMGMPLCFIVATVNE